MSGPLAACDELEPTPNAPLAGWAESWGMGFQSYGFGAAGGRKWGQEGRYSPTLSDFCVPLHFYI